MTAFSSLAAIAADPTPCLTARQIIERGLGRPIGPVATMPADLTARGAPKRIWAAMPLDGQMKPETLYGWTTAENLPEWQSENEAEIELGCDDPLVYAPYILATPAALTASPEVAKLIHEAETRVMRIAAGLFPGGYTNNLTKITEAATIRKGETP